MEVAALARGPDEVRLWNDSAENSCRPFGTQDSVTLYPALTRWESGEKRGKSRRDGRIPSASSQSRDLSCNRGQGSRHGWFSAIPTGLRFLRCRPGVENAGLFSTVPLGHNR